MADFLSTGISGLLAFRRALDTTSHNISNVGTPGYSRQRTEFATRNPYPAGNGYVGNGVEVSTIRRIYDDLLAVQVRNASSSYEGFNTFATYTERVNNLFADTNTGLSAMFQRFANALQDVANAPGSISARQVLLSEAQTLTQRIQSFENQLATIDREVESRLHQEADEISILARSIAQLNGEIAHGYARLGQPPNDLLDERDRLLDELSKHIDVSTVQQDDGQVNVFVGSGQPLVVGGNAARFVTVPSPFDPHRHSIGMQLASGNVVDISNSVTGGSLGGLMQFRAQVLDPTRNSLGRLAVGLANVVNVQHREGLDLTGQLGQDFFGVGGVQALVHNANTGDATLTVTRTNVGALTESDYLLELTGTGWTMRNLQTGATIPLAGDGSAADPLTAEGLSIVVNNTAQVGDRFLVRPTAGAAASLSVLISDPSKIAAASPIRTAADIANAGSAEISAGQVLDPTNPQLQDPVTITFLSPTTYSVNGGPPVAYTSGDPIEINGWSITITGTPATGDVFTVTSNAGGTGDNRNALELVDALRRGVLDSGASSLDATANRIVANIGVATRQAQANRDAQNVIRQEAADARDSVSGVNLDEEAANLLKYQQAYQAAAQLIRVAGTLFDSLLAATRRG
jgi:flagellar hook-associated protein 1 FlgK